MRARKLGRTGHGFTHGNPGATGSRGMVESGVFQQQISSAVAVASLRHAERPTLLLHFQSNNCIKKQFLSRSQLKISLQMMYGHSYVIDNYVAVNSSSAMAGSDNKHCQPHDDAFCRVEDAAVVNGESVSRLRGSNGREREQQPLSTLAVLTRVERVELRQRDDTIVSPGLYGCRSWLGLAHCTGVAIDR
ncbi:hypothetical protein ALC60_02942 [Trachymyrmex zeteki]|uniref:Uncharacterized protein n=1 Tax=Mycetomoellerius zeteki TaxID=64791 RepID=A0A151XC07_9HYME|nr:hypothetical protein ALC60_02942 [Trachymyrmex zeteki]